MYKTLVIGIIFLFVANFAHADSIMSMSNYHNIFMATFMNMSSVKACNLLDLVPTADTNIDKVIQYGSNFNLYDEQTRRIAENIPYYTEVGIAAYKKTAKISCAEVGASTKK